MMDSSRSHGMDAHELVPCLLSHNIEGKDIERMSRL
jgi:hypothetical protein